MLSAPLRPCMCYLSLSPAHAQPQNALAVADEREYMAYSFKAALILCHELAHAVKLCVHEHAHVYFPNGSAPDEEGFEWEQQLLGGIVDLTYERPDNTGLVEFSMVYWPSALLVALYMNKCGIALRGEPPRGEPHREGRQEPIMFLEFDLIRRVFFESFWDLVKKQGPEVLRTKFVVHHHIPVPDLAKGTVLRPTWKS